MLVWGWNKFQLLWAGKYYRKSSEGIAQAGKSHPGYSQFFIRAGNIGKNLSCIYSFLLEKGFHQSERFLGEHKKAKAGGNLIKEEGIV